MYWLEFAGEDDPFAALEARRAASGLEVVGPGIAVARGIAPDRIEGLAFTRAAGDLVGRTDASAAGVRAALEAASIDRSGTVAVRARDVRGSAGVDTRRAERELGAVLVDRGFEVDLDDPDHELRALFAAGALARDPAVDSDDPLEPDARGAVDLAEDADDADRCLLGWTTVRSRRDFGERTPTDRPFFQPGSMDPLLARALANVAGAGPGRLVVDPMCGTGGLLVEASLVGAQVMGVDAQAKMVRGARENLRRYLDREGARSGNDGDPSWDLLRGDATRPPIDDGAADAVVVDVPYERQSAVAGGGLDELVAGALAAARRITPRAVVVGDRPWVGPAREAGWTVETVHRRRVHRSLVRHVHVLVAE